MATTAEKPAEKTEKTSAKKAATDGTGNAQNRFVVSLPADVGEMIDRVGERLRAALEEETGIGFELSRAQIVQALVRQALKDADTGDE